MQSRQKYSRGSFKSGFCLKLKFNIASFYYLGTRAFALRFQRYSLRPSAESEGKFSSHSLIYRERIFTSTLIMAKLIKSIEKREKKIAFRCHYYQYHKNERVFQLTLYDALITISISHVTQLRRYYNWEENFVHRNKLRLTIT